MNCQSESVRGCGGERNRRAPSGGGAQHSMRRACATCCVPSPSRELAPSPHEACNGDSPAASPASTRAHAARLRARGHRALTMSVWRAAEKSRLPRRSTHANFLALCATSWARRLSNAYASIRTQLSSHPHLHGLRDAPQGRLTMVAGCYPTHRGLSTDTVRSRNGPRPSAT